MRHVRTRLSWFLAVAITSAAVLLPDLVWAADHTLAGTRLLSKSGANPSFRWVSKDTAAVFPAIPPTSAGASLKVTSGDGDTTTISLSASYWRLNSPGTRARYKNSAAPGGDSACRLALVAGGKSMKVTCSEDLIDTIDPGTEGIVDVELTIGNDRYCASFGGVERDETGLFKASNAPAPIDCPQTTTTTVGGECPPTSTTTMMVCGQFEQCAASDCAQGQTCVDDGSGGCECVGPSVACGDVYSVGLCALGACPDGMECQLVAYPYPVCMLDCACQ